jgi:NhaP-type Na+/H+ or K+/H+ antiporter
MIGIITGILLKGLNITDTIGELSEHFENLFMIMLLPPIIFESGYNM